MSKKANFLAPNQHPKVEMHVFSGFSIHCTAASDAVRTIRERDKQFVHEW